MIAALLSGLLLLAPQDAAAGAADQDPVAARGAGLEVRLSAVDRLLVERFGMSQNGRALQELLLKSRVLEELAESEGIVVTDDDVRDLWQDLDRRARAAGQTSGLAAEIERRGLTPEEFGEFLRLSIVQTRLAHRALEVADGVTLGADQQEIWLTQVIAERGLTRPLPPWDDGVVLTCGDLAIGREEFGAFLRKRLPEEDVQEACWHLLLLSGIEGRMPDLSPEARARAIEEELGRRRRKHQLEQPAISFEARLGALGRSLDSMRRDPALAIAGLSHLWVDRTHGPEGLRETYEAERSLFEGRFGRAVRAHLLFLVAGRFVNDLNPRTFEMAEDELEGIAERVGDLGDFEALSAQLSEDPTTRENRGDLGWITRGDQRVPAPIRTAAFEFLETGGTVPAGGRTLGTVRLDTGAGLLWVSEVRPSPAWELMSRHVHEELRRRFVEKVMPTGAMEILIRNGEVVAPETRGEGGC
jgi:hypothetical protein